MHKSSTNRIIKRVTEAICELAQQYIRLPEIENEQRMINLMFFEIAAFPKVLGVIDGSHIKIQSSGKVKYFVCRQLTIITLKSYVGGNDAKVFRNRKQYFSINIQAVVDASYKFMNAVTRWPGSAHDMTIGI